MIGEKWTMERGWLALLLLGLVLVDVAMGEVSSASTSGLKTERISGSMIRSRAVETRME